MTTTVFGRSVRLGMAAAAIALAASASVAEAKDFKLTVSSSHPPIVPWVVTLKNYVVPESVKRAKAFGHELSWTEAYAGALYDFQNTLEGIQEGLGDLGWVGTLWEPIKLPLHNVTFYTPFVTGDVRIAADIENEMHEKIPAMRQALIKYNQIYLGPQAIDDYVIISNKPINTVDDLKGMKFYGPGATAAWLRNTGAIAVDGGLPVYYNGIKTGVTHGAIVPGTGIYPFKLHEVAPYVVKVGLGGGITGALTMNKTSYDKLPPELQKMFRDIGKGYGDLVTQRVIALRDKTFNELLPKAGAKVSELPIEEQKKWANLLPDLAGEWIKQVEAQKLPGKEVLAAYMDGVRKRGVTPLRDWDK